MKLVIATFIFLTGAAFADDCDKICRLIPGSCSSKGSYCKNGHTCMDLYWLSDIVICNHTSRECIGRPPVTCAEATGIVASNNARGIRSSASFEIAGTLLGSAIHGLVESQRFRDALQLGVDGTPSEPELNVFIAVAAYAQDTERWNNIHQLALAIEATPAAFASRYRSDLFRQSDAAFGVVFESMVHASTLLDSVLSVGLESGERVFKFTAYTGLGNRRFEDCLYLRQDYSRIHPRQMETVASLPSVIFVRILEYSERASSFSEIPHEFNFNDVAHVQPGAGPARYRLLNTIGYSGRMSDYSRGPQGPVSAHGLTAVIYERI